VTKFNKNELESPIIFLGFGFLASHVASHLKILNYNIRILDKSSCDLLDAKKVASYLKSLPPNPIFIISAAVTRLHSNDKNSFNQNIKIVQNILDSLPQDTEHIIFFSSIDVYGLNPSIPINESSLINPYDHYSMAKFVAEFLLQKESELRGFKLTIFRLSGIYGNGDQGKSTINKMVYSAIKERQIVLTGDPLVERDFIWVNDVAILSDEIIKNSIVGIFNIATGRSITIWNIAKLIAKSVGPKVEILQQLNKKDDNRAFRLHFDITKLKVVFSTIEMTPLEDGLSQYLIDFK